MGVGVDYRQLGRILTRGGWAGLAVAVVWWLVFYLRVADAVGTHESPPLRCLFLNNGPCGMVTGIANAGGYLAYDPLILWLSVAACVAGYAISASAKAPSPSSTTVGSSASSAAEVHNLGDAIHRLHAKWGAIVAFGALLLVLGVAATAFSVEATVATVTLNGVFFLVAGAAEIGIGMQAQDWSRFFLWVMGGLLYLLIGMICILNPLLASVFLTLALGAGLIAAAAVRIYLAFQLPAGSSRAMVFLAGAITGLLGLIIIDYWPGSSLFVLGTLLGIDLIFHGVGWVQFGLALRNRH